MRVLRTLGLLTGLGVFSGGITSYAEKAPFKSKSDNPSSLNRCTEDTSLIGRILGNRARMCLDFEQPESTPTHEVRRKRMSQWAPQEYDVIDQLTDKTGDALLMGAGLAIVMVAGSGSQRKKE